MAFGSARASFSRASTVSRVDSDLVSDADVAQNLARFSRSELVSAIETKTGELAEVEALMAPFKVENVRLSRALKHARAQITCVLQALREFFADPTRREWFKQRKEDKPLCDFFQRLINWYRTVTEESDSTISFYTRIWEYERGDVVDSLQKKPSAESTVDNGSSDGHTLESAASSTNLYEACRQRTENTRLLEETARLEQLNDALLRTNASLEKELETLRFEKHKEGSAEDAVEEGAEKATVAPARSRKRNQTTRTLRSIAAADSRWKRLLDDSDGLFSGDDVIDETYEQYLSDLLALMERHDCTFKRAIELADSGQDSEKPLGEAMSGAGVSRPAEVYPVIPSLVG